MDPYGRPAPVYPGYPMMAPMQPYYPDYYGGYPSGPIPYPEASERDLVMSNVSKQM